MSFKMQKCEWRSLERMAKMDRFKPNKGGFDINIEDIPSLINKFHKLMLENMKMLDREQFLKKLSSVVRLSESYEELKSYLKILQFPADWEDIKDAAELLRKESKEINERKLLKKYFTLFVDKKKFRRKNYIIVVSINFEGKKELLGFYEESDWNAVFKKLKKRGLREVVMIVGREDKKLIDSAMKTNIFKFYQVDWNEVKRTLTKGMKREEGTICRKKLEDLKKIDSYDKVLKEYENICSSYKKSYPSNFEKAIKMKEFYTAFFRFPKGVRSKISTIGTLEALERDIKNRLNMRDKLSELLNDPLLLAYIRVKRLESGNWKIRIPVQEDWANI